MLHLLYARFWHKVLFDAGFVSSPEPFTRLVQGKGLQALDVTRPCRHRRRGRLERSAQDGPAFDQVA